MNIKAKAVLLIPRKLPGSVYPVPGLCGKIGQLMHGAEKRGQIFARTKNLHGSTLRLHGTGGTGRIFERLSVQVWELTVPRLKL